MKETGFEKLIDRCKEYEMIATPGLNYDTRMPETYYIKDLRPDSSMANEIEADGYKILYTLPPVLRELEREYEEGKNFAMVINPDASTNSLSLADRIFDHLERCHHTTYFADRGRKDAMLWQIPTPELLDKFQEVLQQLGYQTKVERNKENEEDRFIFLTAKGKEPAKTIEVKDMKRIYGKNMAKIPSFLEKLASMLGLSQQSEQELKEGVEAPKEFLDLIGQGIGEFGE